MMAVTPVENKGLVKQLKCQCKLYNSCLGPSLFFAGNSAESFPSALPAAADSALANVATAGELKT